MRKKQFFSTRIVLGFGSGITDWVRFLVTENESRLKRGRDNFFVTKQFS